MSTKFAVAAASMAGIASACYLLCVLYKKLQRKELPKIWKRVGTLADMLAYPVKSCGCVELDEAECTRMGLRLGSLRDRTLMVVDKDSNFISARAYPEMLRVRPSFEGSRLTLSHPLKAPCTVDLDEVKNASEVTAKVWSTPVPVHDCGSEASEWFTSLLLPGSTPLRLVYYASSKCRQLRSNTNPIYRFTAEDTGAFPDETSYNLLNEASVDDLSRRLDGHPIKHRQFRPNFVLKGAALLEEDTWKFVRIGDNVFEIIKPCTRCIMTTIDPDTAVKDDKAEPLATLKSYRQVDDPAFRKSAGSSPRMGIQMALRSEEGGRVRLGDPIYASC